MIHWSRYGVATCALVSGDNTLASVLTSDQIVFILSGALMVSIQPHKSITICQNLLEINCAGKTEMKGTLHLTSQCHRVEYLGLFLFNYVRRHSQYATVKGHILKDRAIH